jgi:hypothetical protein
MIELCVTMFDWAKYKQTKGAVKLHLLLDHAGYLPTFALLKLKAKLAPFPKGFGQQAYGDHMKALEIDPNLTRSGSDLRLK